MARLPEQMGGPALPELQQPNESMEWVPELPKSGQRWTVQRKSAVVHAVRGGWVPFEEVCELYGISAEEFVAWERDIDRYGVPGLRVTRFQIYRDTDKKRLQHDLNQEAAMRQTV